MLIMIAASPAGCTGVPLLIVLHASAPFQVAKAATLSCRLARLYHPDKNPAGRDKFVGIQARRPAARSGRHLACLPCPRCPVPAWRLADAFSSLLADLDTWPPPSLLSTGRLRAAASRCSGRPGPAALAPAAAAARAVRALPARAGCAASLQVSTAHLLDLCSTS